MRLVLASLLLFCAGCGGRAARKAPPAPGEEAADATRGGSLDPLGDWESVLANGSPADMFLYLSDDDPAAARDKVALLRPSQRDGIADYILSSCGTKTAGWKFNLSSALSPGQRRFASWFLKTQTSYKPR